MSYNLTESQKDLARWIVEQVRDGELEEDFTVVWTPPEIGGPGSGSVHGSIFECPGHPKITPGLLDALAQAGLLLCRPSHQSIAEQFGKTIYGEPVTKHREHEVNRTCTLTARAYEAVANDFEPPSDRSDTQVTIGAVIQSVSGGTVQAVGVAKDAEISQIVNDPELLRSQLEALTDGLLNTVKPALSASEIAEYAQALQALEEQLLSDKPEPSVIRRLIQTLGLLGDIDGTIELMTKVWPFLQPLLMMAATILGQYLAP
jgi:hypothetical protein